MGELIDFANTHPVLASVVVGFLVAVLVYEVRLKGQGIVRVSSGMAVQLINRGAVVIDVRPAEAYAAGHIANAKNIPFSEIASKPEIVKKKKDKVLLTVCDNGQLAQRAADSLRKSGYESAFSLQGGLMAWRGENLPIVK